MDGSKDTNDRTQEHEGASHESETVPLQTSLGPGIKLKNRYVIERELGQGGFGVVYLARDEELLSKRVVIKVLLEELVQDSWFKKKFQQEKEALARIDHPGVVGVLDSGRTPDGKHFLVMQFVEGQTLASLITAEGMELEQVARIMQQMGKALTAAHNEGIIHCDLKPENVIVQKAGEDDELTKIIDFGIAKVRDSQVARGNEPTRVAGTLYYTAPEQIGGSPSASSDIYSMGVLAYVMVTGRRPFNPASGPPHVAAQEMLRLQKSGVRFKPKDLRQDLPDAAQRTILKALSFDPVDRYTQARDFGNALAQAIAGAEHETESSVEGPAEGPVLEIAHVLFLDIVGYSKTLMQQQAETTKHLQEIVRAAAQFRRAQVDKKLLSLPTGDGMALVFFGDPVTPLKCAKEITLALKNQPQIGMRMGLHSGPVYRVTDINANLNIVGGGINIAQRVMDCGDAGHIIVSKAIADVLKQLDGYAELVHDLGECEVKHGERIHIYNLYDGEIGNPALPNKLKKAQPRSHKRAIAIGVAAILALIIIAAVRVWVMRPPSGTNVEAAVPELALDLSLEAQKPTGPVVPLYFQIDSNGEIDFNFDVGDGIRLRLVTSQSGYLYILNDAAVGDVLILFPTPGFNGGSARLLPEQEIFLPPKGWFRSNHAGYERFWVALAAQPIGVLEELIQSGKSAASGTYDPRRVDRAREFLTKQSAAKPQTALDYEKRQLNLKVNNDVLAVSLLKR